MNFLRVIVAFIPFALQSYGEARVSFSRIKKLLLMEEHTKPSSNLLDDMNAIEISSANFTWENYPNILDKQNTQIKGNKSSPSVESSKQEPNRKITLSGINLSVRKGDLIGICGAVGCGKSSVLSAVLGRMQLMKGHLAVDGRVAYVSQQAWILNSSIKENILFGQEFNSDRYQEVIECCALEPDLKMLADGDETEIGERGTNISGGQKQRVNLARAVYSGSDIYLLDDPLSALDARVGQQIFQQCIRGVLKGKTVILVTHQLQYLNHCDQVIVMAEGGIVESGKHQQLIDNNGLYADMFRIFSKTSLNSAEPETTDSIEPAAAQLKMHPTLSSKPKCDNNINGSVANGKQAAIKQTAKLVVSEEVAIGDVKFSTYNAYVQAAGGWLIAAGVIATHIAAAGSLIFSDWWLSDWINSLINRGLVFSTESSSDTYPAHGSAENVSHTTSSTFNVTSDNSLLISQSHSDSLSNRMYLVVYISSLAGVIFLQLLKGFSGAKASVNAARTLHAKCLDKVMKSPMSFFESNPTGRILNRFSKDLDEIDTFIPQVTHSLLQISTIVLLSIALSASVTPWLLIALVPIVAVFYLMKQISTVCLRQLKRLENISRSPLISHVNITAQGLQTVVAFNQQERFFKKLTSFGDVATMSTFLFDVSMRWIGLRLDLMSGLMTVSVTLIFVITKGYISPASAGLVLGLCGKTVSLVQFLVRLMNEVEARFTSVERLHEYASKLPSEAQNATKTVAEGWPDKGEIAFHNAVMSYRPNMDPVLKTVSFHILPQEKVGVVGRTGAGKSSLAVALFRLVELGSGHIYVDGEDISKLPLSTIRSKISTITQDPVLFNGTIRYNVDPFSLYTDDSIWHALEKVHMKEKILKSEGLEGIVQENGENFSVGERQLLCLARAVLRCSKILLLDEATANIDTTTDAMIQETIRDCFSTCTVITIAHRLNTVLHCDKIIVMDSGKVMECNSPQVLLSNNSFFSSMIAAHKVHT